jgi:uncharacterized membrane protein YvbJ
MTMIFCRACGKEIHETAPLCPRCGAAQTISQPLQQKTAHPGWMAITSLAIGCLSLLASIGSDGIKEEILGSAMFAIVGIVFGVINLQQQRAGKTMAIAAIVVASATLLICLGSTT